MTEQPGRSTLDYARAGAIHPTKPRIDVAMLLLGIAQSVMALVFCVGVFSQSLNGRYELKHFLSSRVPAQEVGWIHRLAWNLFGPVNPAMFVAWLVASLGMAIGSISLSPAVRRRWYRIGAGVVIGAIAIMLIALFILDGSNISERWVHQSGTAYEWRTIVIEPVYYWQLPVISLIANPTLILWALLRRRIAQEDSR